MKKNVDIGRLFAEGKPIDRALRAGVRAALLRHKRLGQPVVDVRNGRIILVPPEEIERLIKRIEE